MEGGGWCDGAYITNSVREDERFLLLRVRVVGLGWCRMIPRIGGKYSELLRKEFVKRSMDGVHEEGDPRMLDNSKFITCYTYYKGETFTEKGGIK